MQAKITEQGLSSIVDLCIMKYLLNFIVKFPKREFDCFSCPALLVAPGGKVAVRPLVETLN